jgi:protein-S-isoprenylcysteine O-methyltransferase Ste14
MLSHYKEPKALFIFALQLLSMSFIVASPFFDRREVSTHMPQSPHEILACILTMIGFVTIILSVRALDNSFTASPVPKETGELVTHGPFAYVRNPIYSAGIIMGMGWALWFESIGTAVWVIVLFFILWRKVLLEEENLLSKFGQEYADYRARVPRFFPKF